jgi:hypothetical protein
VLSVHETIPVEPGEVTLLYPKWIPDSPPFVKHFQKEKRLS